ncbi:MAG TPA: glycoside hydrolase family 13 protein, partial [Clostridia bacterium]|nr:glycoside hydrolase family 13 protein [Clostridia bacterium]
MLNEAVLHITKSPYVSVEDENSIRVRLRIKKGDAQFCFVAYHDRYNVWYSKKAQMRKTDSDMLYDYYEASVGRFTKRIEYQFCILSNDGCSYWYGNKGISTDSFQAGTFQFPYLYGRTNRLPEWVHNAVVYQIYPDSFFDGDPGNNPEHLQRWGSKPDGKSYYGGDLKGIIKKLGHLSSLGVDALYLNPIFMAASPHRYNTVDYYTIDPSLGDIETFDELVSCCHKKGIKVILDGVFNHIGSESEIFKDVIKNGEKSKYAGWFNIYSFPVTTSPVPNYETFSNNIGTMPKIFTDNTEVQDYFLKIAEFWTKRDVDGWRLDVANELDRDFIARFRDTVKSINPDAFIIGEIMHEADDWVGEKGLDGVTNQPVYNAIVDFFARKSIGVIEFDNRLASNRASYKSGACSGHFTYIGNHDQERFYTKCKDCSNNDSGWHRDEFDTARTKLAILFKMTYVGIPVIYYGDEIGMEGGNDPDCRRSMIWSRKKQNKEIFEFYKKLIKHRKHSSALKKGDFKRLLVIPSDN